MLEELPRLLFRILPVWEPHWLLLLKLQSWIRTLRRLELQK